MESEELNDFDFIWTGKRSFWSSVDPEDDYVFDFEARQERTSAVQ